MQRAVAVTSMLAVEDIPIVFGDLTPIPQNDGPDRVCVIEYPSAFSLAYNYMRAVWAAKELSGTNCCFLIRCLLIVDCGLLVYNIRVCFRK